MPSVSQIRRIFAPMKRIANILLAAFAIAPAAMAQEDVECPRLAHDILVDEQRERDAEVLVDLPMGRSVRSQLDMAPSYAFASPWAHGAGPGYWRLHEGFNAEVGFSVSGAFGKGSPKGAGFGEHIAAAYAMPFGKDKRWIGAFGVYADRLDWGGYNRTEAGISGMLGYHVNDWCDLYVYGSYNFVPGTDNGGPNPYAYAYGPWGYSPWGYGGYCGWGYGGYGHYGPYGYGPYGYDAYNNLRGRVGAAAQFKLGENSHLTVAFEYSNYDRGKGMWPVAAPPQPAPQNQPFGVYDSPETSGRGSNVRRMR